jgi:hypothetical protein
MPTLCSSYSAISASLSIKLMESPDCLQPPDSIYIFKFYYTIKRISDTIPVFHKLEKKITAGFCLCSSSKS